MRRRAEIVQYIANYTEAFGRPPTYREIAERFDMAPATVAFHVKKLVDDKVLRLDPGHRNLRVL